MIRTLSVVTFLVWACAAVGADAPMVFDGCHYHGYYEYIIDSGSYPIMEFTVGTGDLDIENYQNIVLPPGWHFEVAGGAGFSHGCGVLTLCGLVSTAACDGLTQGRVRWWTDDPQFAVEFFTFSFTHPWRPEDVGWALHTRREGPPPSYYTFTEFWDAPVGTGYGPLHGPYAPFELCWSNLECEDGWYCFFADCGLETGMCVPRPAGCPEIWAPACACDGLTYPNACEAAMAGVSFDHDLPCLLGDLDADNDVDFDDLNTLLAHYGQTGNLSYYWGNLDDDLDIDFDDLNLLLSNYTGPI